MEEWQKKLRTSPMASLWDKIGIKPHHGINIFLPALRTKKSCGIGEFLDLISMIDWCQKLKLDVIQLLPLNYSGYDPSPYNPLSSCALNFILLSLWDLPHLSAPLREKLQEFSPFNTPQSIPYKEVLDHKLHWLHAYFADAGAKIIQSPEYLAFLNENSWVEPFARFCDASQIPFYCALQFLCYAQLKKVKDYANSKGVFLKGDIPILVGADSADVKQHPEYFNTGLAAGAPPDMYYQEGQYWGFPLFRWDKMRHDHFSWWNQRLKYASNFYDLFRIDHVIGFFRIWAIPLKHPAKEGHYIPQAESAWEAQGRELLHMIISYAHGMMPIAEDLGTLPAVLPICLKEFGICGTKVMRWERFWKKDRSYIPIDHYPPASLTCVSTHDSETLTQWWKDCPEESHAFAKFKKWHYHPQLTKPEREEILRDSHHTTSLFHINLLQEYLALFPELVWPHPEDERINVPGIVLPSNWTYRYHPSVEEITSHEGLRLCIMNICM